MTTVAVCQLGLAVGEVAANRAAASAAIREAAEAGAGLVVLPELTPTGYAFGDRAEARGLAERADGPTTAEWASLARRYDLVIVGGFCELAGEVVYNSAAIVDRDGLRAVYRKAHLWDAESAVFAAGNAEPPVVTTPVGRVGVIVCYDAEFPEWVRRPALAGAELLAVPVNWPAQPYPPGERPLVTVHAQAAAGGNRMFVAVADRCLAEREISWLGGSMIIGPDGYPRAGPLLADRAGMLLARCDLAEARSKSIGARNDVHADRRADLYGPPAP